MEWLSNPESWIALLTLTVLEIVLGIDNVIFISILAGKLPQEQQGKARKCGAGPRHVHPARPAGFDRLDRPADRAALHGSSARRSPAAT